MNRLNLNRRQKKTIHCNVLASDIEEMLDRFDSGMCDLTTHNAVALALRRELGSDVKIRVISDACHEGYCCRIEKESYLLPDHVSVWLDGCYRGLPAEPIEFNIEIEVESEILTAPSRFTQKTPIKQTDQLLSA